MNGLHARDKKHIENIRQPKAHNLFRMGNRDGIDCTTRHGDLKASVIRLRAPAITCYLRLCEQSFKKEVLYIWRDTEIRRKKAKLYNSYVVGGRVKEHVMAATTIG